MFQYTRLPVYKGKLDDLIGMIHVRTILNLNLKGKLNLQSLLSSVETPYFIPESTTLNIQIINFQKMKRRCSFVVDEYGNMQGLVTMEDILEEIVGEYTTDVASWSKFVVSQKDGSFIIDASITLRQLNRLLRWKFPINGPKTLNGLVIEHLGHIPDTPCCTRIENYLIEILRISENTIRSVKIRAL